MCDLANISALLLNQKSKASVILTIRRSMFQSNTLLNMCPLSSPYQRWCGLLDDLSLSCYLLKLFTSDIFWKSFWNGEKCYFCVCAWVCETICNLHCYQMVAKGCGKLSKLRVVTLSSIFYLKVHVNFWVEKS